MSMALVHSSLYYILDLNIEAITADIVTQYLYQRDFLVKRLPTRAP